MSAVTATEQDRIRQMVARGMSCNAIARELGRGPATISRQARKLGLSFDRASTATATEARVIDLAARRARAAEAQADIAERLQGQVFAPAKMHSIGGRDNIHTEHDLDEPLFHDKLELVRATQVAWTTSMKLTEFSAGEADSGARSLIGGLAAAFKVAADNLPPDDDGPDAA